MQLTRVALSVPKFKFESKYEDDLKDALIQTGIESPFSFGTGALCGLLTKESVGCNKLKIDKGRSFKRLLLM